MWTARKPALQLAALALCLAPCTGQKVGAGNGTEAVEVKAAAKEASADKANAPTAPAPSCSIVGASVSCGMDWRSQARFAGNSDPIEYAEKQLKRAIEDREFDLRTDSLPLAKLIALLDPDGRIRIDNQSQVILRNAPLLIASQLNHATAKSRLVVGIDLMVWFGYGDVPQPPAGATAAERAAHQAEQRLQLQATAFALIDKCMAGNDCVFVIGDYPDLREGNAVLMRPHQRPTAEVLTELNRRLREFAAERERVVLFPMHDLLEAAVRHELEVEIGGKTRRLRSADVLQLDEIHPNRLGVAILLTHVAKVVKAEAPQVADCLPELPDLEAMMTTAGIEVEDLDYLARRGRHAKPGK
ncbi:MAG: hypothetical protein KDC98_10580 [Planctomycetes bacterium]|nr:hypothetical protein [Planctomycetota bacterium]